MVHRRGGIDRRDFLTGAAALGGAAALPAFAEDTTPRKGGTLRIGMSGGAVSDSLDPRLLTDWVPVNICYQLMNGLVEIGDDNKPKGELLEAWDVKPGAKEWVFDVRKGVTFSNGKTLDADDVIYSINLHRGDTKSPGKVNVEDVTDIRKLGPNRIAITLGNGNVDLPYLLSDYHFLVVPDGFTDWARPVGTAGYVLEAHDPGVRAITRRRDDYWKPGSAHVDAIQTLTINDTVARTNALAGGLVDVINRLDARTVRQLEKSPKLQVIRNPAGQHATFLMMTTDQPYTDNNVRLAMKYVVDRQKMIDIVLAGCGALGNDHPIPRTNPYHADDLPQHGYNPDRAKFHLKQAGLATLSVQLQISDAAFPGAVDAALLYQEAAAPAGVTMDVKRVAADGYWSNTWLKAPFCASYWGGRPTADQMLTIAYKSDAKWNETAWHRAAFDQTLVAARTELDEGRRKQMYVDLQTMIHDDAGVTVPMFIDYLEAGSTRVKGLRAHPLYDLMGQRLGERVWLDA